MTCGRNSAVRAVVLTGAGRNFCFGGDLRGMLSKGKAADAYLRELTTYLHEAISHFARMDAPLVAAVNGTAAGAGVGLAAMADLTLCGETSKFNLAYTAVGLTPDAGTSFLLPRVIGTKRAMELFLLNRSLTSAEALNWGLVNSVVSDEELMNEALKLADRLAAGATHAFGRTKRLVQASLGAFESQMALEAGDHRRVGRQRGGARGHPRVPRQAQAVVRRGGETLDDAVVAAGAGGARGHRRDLPVLRHA